jgi:hypothetical protein
MIMAFVATWDKDNGHNLSGTIGLILISAQSLLVKPYIDIVRSCLKIPMPQTYSADYSDLERSIQKAASLSPLKPKRQKLIAKCRFGVNSFLGRMGVLESSALSAGLLDVFLEERASYALELLGSRMLLEKDEDRRTLNRLQLVIDGKSLAPRDDTLEASAIDEAGVENQPK